MNVNIIDGGTGTTRGASTPILVYAVGTAGTPAPFWEVAGGLQVYDVAHTPPPLFQDDLIVRGGKVTFHVAIDGNVTDAVGVRLFWIRTFKDSVPGFIVLGSSFGPQTWGWDPSCFANFDRLVGKVMFTNEAVLNEDNHYVTFEAKLPVQKVNQVDWLQGGPQTALVLHTTNLTSTNNVSIRVAGTWNMSFSGDANGQTGALASAVTQIPQLRVSTRSRAATSDSGMVLDPPTRKR